MEKIFIFGISYILNSLFCYSNILIIFFTKCVSIYYMYKYTDYSQKSLLLDVKLNLFSYSGNSVTANEANPGKQKTELQLCWATETLQKKGGGEGEDVV